MNTSCIVTFYYDEAIEYVDNFLPYITNRMIIFVLNKNDFFELMKKHQVIIKKNIVVYECTEIYNFFEFVDLAIKIIEEKYDSYVWVKIDAIKNRILSPFLRFFPDQLVDQNHSQGIYFTREENQEINNLICYGAKDAWKKYCDGMNNGNSDPGLVNIIDFDPKNWMIAHQPTKELYMLNHLIKPKKFCIGTGARHGLGNILFFIVSAFGYSVKTNRVFFLSNSQATTSSHSLVDYEKTLFKYFVKNNVSEINDIIKLYEPRFDTCINPDKDNLEKNCSLYNYLQNEKYFIHIRDELLEIFGELYTDQSPDQCMDYFIHIRRGDYVNNINHEMNLIKYYKDSITWIKKKDDGWKDRNFVVLSDGIDWCIQNKLFQEHGIKINYIENMNEIETFKLMVNTRKGGIGSNSTYSWWGLWLNKNPDAIKILPKNWKPIKENPQIQFAGATLIDT